MKVKIKKELPGAKSPTYGTVLAAGFDLYAAEPAIVLSGETVIVSTGLVFEIPEGYEVQVRPRSGLSAKTKLRIANAPGTIDADYRGVVGIIVENIGQHLVKIHKGERIAQGILAPVLRAEFEEVNELSDTDRGTGGFGHTGV